MARSTPPPDPHTPSFDAAFAALASAVEAKFAGTVPQPRPANRPFRVPGAAEQDLFRTQLTRRIQALLCTQPHACADHRCRRQRICRELVDLDRLVEELHEQVAAEQRAIPAAAAAPVAPQRRGRGRAARHRTSAIGKG